MKAQGVRLAFIIQTSFGLSRSDYMGLNFEAKMNTHFVALTFGWLAARWSQPQKWWSSCPSLPSHTETSSKDADPLYWCKPRTPDHTWSSPRGGWPPWSPHSVTKREGGVKVYKTGLVGKGIKNRPSIYKSYQLWFNCNRCHLSCWRKKKSAEERLISEHCDKIPRLILQPQVSSEQNSRYSQWSLNCSHPLTLRGLPWANKSWKKASKLTGTIYQLEVFNSMPSPPGH